MCVVCLRHMDVTILKMFVNKLILLYDFVCIVELLFLATDLKAQTGQIHPLQIQPARFSYK